jgi:hypothetical protein
VYVLFLAMRIIVAWLGSDGARNLIIIKLRERNRFYLIEINKRTLVSLFGRWFFNFSLKFFNFYLLTSQKLIRKIN